jgi:hypothetical protein
MANMKYAVGQPFQVQTRLEGDMYGSVSSPTLIGGTGPVASHPVSNVSDEHIIKSCRTTGFADMRITFNLPGNPAGILVEGLNSDADVRLGFGGSNTITSTSSTVTPVMNKRTGSYGFFAELSGSGDHWGIAVSGSSGDLISAAEYTSGWEVGRITWVQTLNTMSQNWQLPLNQATGFEGAQRILAGGKTDSTASSRGYNVIDLHGSFDRNKGDNILDDIGAMARCSPTDRYLIWFNNGDVSEAYLCMKSDFTGNLDEFPTISVDLGLREAI